VTLSAAERDLILTRAQATRAAFEATRERLQDTQDRVRQTLERIASGRPQRDLTRESALVRLRARLDSMPVVEQAKGIIMAQTGCSADVAFEMLRQASQRSNVKVRTLAAEIIEHAVRSADGAGAPRQRPARAPGQRQDVVGF
jgi:ANTAR domain